MSISTVKALVPNACIMQPVLQDTRVDLFNDQDRVYRLVSHPDMRAKRYHQAYDPYGILQDGCVEVGGIVDIYV